MPDLANEALERLMEWLAEEAADQSEPTPTTLASLLGVDAQSSPAGPCLFFDQPATGGKPFPILVVGAPESAKRGTDAEGHRGAVESLQIDIFGPDVTALRTIARVLDDAAELSCVRDNTGAGTLDTENYRVTIFARVGPWRLLDWRMPEQEGGNPVSQLTADWLFKSGQKQGA